MSMPITYAAAPSPAKASATDSTEKTTTPVASDRPMRRKRRSR